MARLSLSPHFAKNHNFSILVHWLLEYLLVLHWSWLYLAVFGVLLNHFQTVFGVHDLECLAHISWFHFAIATISWNVKAFVIHGSFHLETHFISSEILLSSRVKSHIDIPTCAMPWDIRRWKFRKQRERWIN